MLVHSNTDIEVEFTQVLFSGDESSGFIEARVMASGFSPWPYEVVIVPSESDPPSALGIVDLQFVIHNGFVLIGYCYATYIFS